MTTLPATSDWTIAATEPTLADMFSDPIFHLLLRRDRLTLGAVEATLLREQARLGAHIPPQTQRFCHAA